MKRRCLTVMLSGLLVQVPGPVLRLTTDSAIVERGGKEVLRVPLQEKRVIDPEEETYFFDDAYLVAGLLVVIRNSVGAPYCRGPGGDSAELYGLEDGGLRVLRDKELINALHGNRFTAPSGQWGVVLEVEEGRIFGYTYLRPDGSYQRHQFSEDFDWLGFGQEGFRKDGSLAFPGLRRTDVKGKDRGPTVTLIVDSGGAYRFESQ